MTGIFCEMDKEYSDGTLLWDGLEIQRDTGDILLSKVAKETIFIISKIITSAYHTSVLPIESRKNFLEDK